MENENSVYGINTKAKKASGTEYFGFTLKGDEPYYEQLMNDMEAIRKKLGVTGKKMILLGAIKIASEAVKNKGK